MSLPEMECTICHRVWTPTMFDDCFLPVCHCFGTEFDRDTPCNSCGLSHAWACPKIEGNAANPNPKVMEILPDGSTVHRGRLSQESENRILDSMDDASSYDRDPDDS